MKTFHVGLYIDHGIGDFVIYCIYSDKEQVQKALDELPESIPKNSRINNEMTLDNIKDFLLKRAIEQAKLVQGLTS